MHSNPEGLTCGEVNAREPRFLALVTSMFLHGGWFHLLGNMLFLWVFGNNIEDRLGRIRFLPFYLLCGIVAGLGQALADTSSDVPLVGASGAIAGVLGGYILLYPRARVLTLILLVFIPIFLRLPAMVVLGIWFLEQIAFGYFDVNSGGETGGVAYFAHIGGFLFGLLAIRAFAGRPPPPAPRRPQPSPGYVGRW